MCIRDRPGSELTSLFREVWELVAGEQGELRREEAFLLLLSLIHILSS